MHGVWSQITSPTAIKLSLFNETKVEIENPSSETLILHAQFSDANITLDLGEGKECASNSPLPIVIPEREKFSMRIATKASSDKKRYIRLHSHRVDLFRSKIICFVIEPRR